MAGDRGRKSPGPARPMTPGEPETHARESQDSVDTPSEDRPEYPVEFDATGRPIRWAPAENEKAAHHWDPRNWRPL